MSKSLRERIEGLRPVISWGPAGDEHDLIDKALVLRIIADREREQAAVAMGMQPVAQPGRRRWRKWLRKWRRAEGRKAQMFEPHVAPYVRRHQRTWDNGPVVCGPIPTPAFTARSLCGMSQSARKRAARFVTLSGRSRLGELGSAASGIKPSRRLYSLRLFHRDYQKWTPFAKSHYVADREPFRIGERLRPCPGCPRCNKRCTFLPDRLDKWFAHAKDCPDGCEAGNGCFVEGTPCDASGIMPARERKARR